MNVNSQEVATVKRAAAFVITTALMAFQKKLGLQLDPVTIASIAGFAAFYIGQSASKSAKALAAVKVAEDLVPGLAAPEQK